MEPKSGNYEKYMNSNPLMQRAIAGFLGSVESLTASLNVGTILDAGCGEGFVSRRLGNKALIGMDISSSALNIAKQNNPDAVLVQGSIYDMPFKQESFDLVMATEVLEHLKEPEKAMLELSRLSRRYCLFSVPNEPYFRIIDLFRGKNVLRLGSDIEHVHNWSERRFVELASKHFDVVKTRSPFPWTVVLCQKRPFEYSHGVEPRPSESGLL
jgi:SAM-dependent methyltransferase